MIRKQTLWILGAIVASYMLLSIPVFLLIRQGLHSMLAWNVLLAFLPVVFAANLAKAKAKSKWLFGLALGLWLLFFPNTFYIITDFIYLNQADFVLSESPYEPVVYQTNLLGYLGLFHIACGALIGIVLGIVSLESVRVNVLYPRFKSKDWVWIILIFALSGVGIYIGRFFRFNSWDVWKLPVIIRDIFSHISWFTVFFILSFMVIQALCYVLFRVVKNDIFHSDK